MDTSTTKDKLARFGRTLALLLNRSLMYQKSHPMVKGAIEDAYKIAKLIFQTISPVVFILNRAQFYVDEEQLDPRINTKRIAHVFKTHGIQSISFEAGLTVGEIEIFIDIFSSMTSSTNADIIKSDLIRRGTYNLKVNHVQYKKVTEDDQVISRDALKQVTPSMEDDDSESRKKFMDTLLETILTDEFANTLNIKNLIDNPGQVSKTMIEADLASVDKLNSDNSGFGGSGTEKALDSRRSGLTALEAGDETTSTDVGGVAKNNDDMHSGKQTGLATSETIDETISIGVSSEKDNSNVSDDEQRDITTLFQDTQVVTNSPTAPETTVSHGNMLLHQLDLMQQEVKKHLAQGGDISIEALADAVFEMKKQLFEDIQTQKALGIAYANENAIVSNINELTDQVILKLIEDEYKTDKITTQRFAQIILRLIPDAKELKRLLPKIKDLLFENGMSPEAYLQLVDELKHELQNEDLSRIIEESSEAIGIDSEALIQELKEDPDQAAKLIYLASEIRKGGADESALADILIDYVEQMTRQVTQASGDEEGEGHLKKVISNVESTLLGHLSQMDVSHDVLLRLENRVNERMDSILDRMRVEWLQNRAVVNKQEKIKPLTVLQTLEHNVGEDEDLAEILKTVRTKVDDGQIEENNFSQIHTEINHQKILKETQAKGLHIPEGVLSPNELIFILEKEIARANRYNSHFSALAFSLVDAKPKMKALEKLVTDELVMAAALDKLMNTIREVDYVGQIGKNKMVALLPMQSLTDAKLALARMTNLLHNKPLVVNEIPVQLHFAGVVAEYDIEQAPDARIFAKQISNQLMDMVSRVKNIRVLF